MIEEEEEDVLNASDFRNSTAPPAVNNDHSLSHCFKDLNVTKHSHRKILSIIQNSKFFGSFGNFRHFRQSIEKAEIAEDAKIVDHILAFSEISAI